MTMEVFDRAGLARCRRCHARRPPPVQCLTNDVVQEITANVLLAAGASPAMVVSPEDSGDFARFAHAVLVNIGTPTPERIEGMRRAVEGAEAVGHPWVLDPVAAGILPWRDGVIRSFVERRPTVIRGNASEISRLGRGRPGGCGVDSTDASDAAVETAKRFATETGSIVVVTGERDFVTDGRAPWWSKAATGRQRSSSARDARSRGSSRPTWVRCLKSPSTPRPPRASPPSGRRKPPPRVFRTPGTFHGLHRRAL